MSGFRYWLVACDYMDANGRECGVEGDSPYWTLTEARKYADKEGWRVALPGGRDLCPKHHDEPVPTHRAGT